MLRVGSTVFDCAITVGVQAILVGVQLLGQLIVAFLKNHVRFLKGTELNLDLLEDWASVIVFTQLPTLNLLSFQE